MLFFIVFAGINMTGCGGTEAQSGNQASIEIQPEKIPAKQELAKPGDVMNILDRASSDTECELPANMQ